MEEDWLPPEDPQTASFCAESREITERLGRALLALEASLQANERFEHADLNEAFRSLHTQKSLAAMLGLQTMASLAHELESRLDKVRLGQAVLDLVLLDQLFDTAEAWTLFLQTPWEKENAARIASQELQQRLLFSLRAVSAQVPPRRAKEGVERTLMLPPESLAVLTEAEEAQIRSAMAQGEELYQLTQNLDLTSIEVTLDALREELRGWGQLITYLPLGEGATPDSLEVAVLVSSRESPESFRGRLPDTWAVLDLLTPVSARSSGSLVGSSDEALADFSVGTDDARAPLARDELEHQARYAVRVDLRKLEPILSSVGELAIVKNGLLALGQRLQRTGDRSSSAMIRELHRAFERELQRLQSGILEVRLVTLAQVFEALSRSVRQAARDANRPVQLIVTGADTEVDKLIVDQIGEPLLHVLRNAIDHGIEEVAERRALGKPDEGTLAINVYQSGGRVMIEMEDDGRGVESEKVRARIVRLGLATASEAEALSERELFVFLFEPGFSTREQASTLSGRGVGLDVVKTRVQRLGGSIEIRSSRNIGTAFTLSLPVTLAVLRVLTIHVSGQIFCVPLAAIDELVIAEDTQLRREAGRMFLQHRSEVLPLLSLPTLFAARLLPRMRRTNKLSLLILRSGATRAAVLVDAFGAQEEVVVKPLGPSLAHSRLFSGAADLGQAQLVLILDVASLLETNQWGAGTFDTDLRKDASMDGPA
jgi:two-component system, chemotaxis family, sensor kinase CheA